MKFQVGDRVRCIERRNSHENQMGTIVDVDNRYGKSYPYFVKFDRFGLEQRYMENQLQKIGEEKMNRYDELKKRISNVTAWDKEADDISQEIIDNIEDKSNCITIGIAYFGGEVRGKGAIRIYNNGFKWMKEDSAQDWIKSFEYDNQCEKLQAFKDALIWLLDHSDIKKTIVGTKQQVKIENKIYEAEIIKEV